MDQSVVRSLIIDRSKSNLTFSSWRLSRGAIKAVSELALSASVATTDAAELDYVHTYFTALHNNLLCGGQFLFLRKDHELQLQRLSHTPSPSLTLEAGARTAGFIPCAGLQVSLVAVQPSLSDSATRLQCRLVTAVLPTAQQTPSQPASMEPALPPSVAEVARTDGQPAGLLVVSTGVGDLLAVRRSPEGGATLTAAAYPLRPTPPLEGCRPFFLEAAMQAPGTAEVRCVLWAVCCRSGAHPSRCEVFAVTLELAPAAFAEGQSAAAAAGAQQQLIVRDVRLLRWSPLSPHGVLLNPATGSILLAAAPAPESEAEGQQGNGQAAAKGRAEPVDDSEDPVSPRTLQAAVARLEQFTSQEQAGPQPPAQWADLYSESGPDGVGDLGQEPGCTLSIFDAQLQCMEQVPCHPHKVLTCHRQAGCLLLGLTDDVDCAVVELAPAGGQVDGEGQRGAAEGGSSFEGGFSIRHVGSIPALAYIAAGKMQRKFLLLSPPGSALAAALLESHVYAYLYTATTPGQEYGEQEMVELGFERGAPGVVGAALAGQEGGGGSRLFLLSDRTLRVYELI